MYVPVITIGDLRTKISACNILGIKYKLVGKIQHCIIDFAFADEGILYCEEPETHYNDVPYFTPRNDEDTIIKRLYNFNDRVFQFKALKISLDVEGKHKISQEFIVTTTENGEEYFKLTEDSELWLDVEKIK